MSLTAKRAPAKKKSAGTRPKTKWRRTKYTIVEPCIVNKWKGTLHCIINESSPALCTVNNGHAVPPHSPPPAEGGGIGGARRER